MNKCTFIIAFLILMHSSLAQEKLPPPKMEISDPLLNEFVTRLKNAVKEKDKNFIISILSPDIMNGFGGNNGIEEFKDYWNWSSNNTSFWKIMGRLLEMGGGTYEDTGQYTIPYVSFDWPEEFDPYEYAAITGTNVNVRDQANVSSSTVLSQFTYDIVKVDYERSYPDFEDPEWYFVESLDGETKGYVYWKYVWSPIGYRAFFKKINNTWKMTILLAGD